MPRIKMTKSNIDALPIGKSDVVYWDAGWPGFGVKVTPKGRKVFIVLYRTAGAGSKFAQVHHWAVRARDSSSGARGSAEGVRSQARWPRSGRRKTRGEAAGRSRSGR